VISKARLKYLRSLRRKKTRQEEGALLVEGLNVVEEAVAAGEVRELLLSDEIAHGPRGRALIERGLPVQTLSESDTRALAETRTPAGAFALVADPCGPFDPAQLPDEALVLLAAGVADPGNLGTLVRTSAALGVAAVVTAAGTVEATNPKVVRATAGALFRIPVRAGEAAALKEAGFQIYVAGRSPSSPTGPRAWRWRSATNRAASPPTWWRPPMRPSPCRRPVASTA
jgi:TrmH family RNA methyltransferase